MYFSVIQYSWNKAFYVDSLSSMTGAWSLDRLFLGFIVVVFVLLQVVVVVQLFILLHFQRIQRLR